MLGIKLISTLRAKGQVYGQETVCESRRYYYEAGKFIDIVFNIDIEDGEVVLSIPEPYYVLFYINKKFVGKLAFENAIQAETYIDTCRCMYVSQIRDKEIFALI